MAQRPDNCESCKRKAQPGRLKYCRKCRRYVCSGNYGCWESSYCIGCSAEKRREAS